MLETMRKTAGGIAVLLLLAMPPTAGAQTLDPASLHEVDNRIAAKAGMGHEGRSIAQLERTTVLHHGRVIGRIQEVLADAQERVVAVVIEHGGFLGLGERRTAVPIAALRFGKGGAAALTLGEEELRGLPAWDR